MNILESILQAQGGGATRQLGQHFGLSDNQVSAALSALVPALAAGFQKNMSSPQGFDSLVAALGAGQHQQYVDDAASLNRTETVADGNGILGHVFGSKEVSRQVASRAANRSGISESVLKSMLPVVAAMMMGSMSKQVTQPAGLPAGAGTSQQGLLGMLTPMLDSNRDGSVVDDVLGMIGRFSSR